MGELGEKIYARLSCLKDTIFIHMKIKFCKHREEEKHDNEKFQENDKKFFFHFFFSKSFHLISFQRKFLCFQRQV